jgi:hypothetical protein
MAFVTYVFDRPGYPNRTTSNGIDFRLNVPVEVKNPALIEFFRGQPDYYSVSDEAGVAGGPIVASDPGAARALQDANAQISVLRAKVSDLDEIIESLEDRLEKKTAECESLMQLAQAAAKQQPTQVGLGPPTENKPAATDAAKQAALQQELAKREAMRGEPKAPPRPTPIPTPAVFQQTKPGAGIEGKPAVSLPGLPGGAKVKA